MMRLWAVLMCLFMVASCATTKADDVGEAFVIGKTSADGADDGLPRPFNATADANLDVDIALAAAQAGDKPAIFVFGANWCHDSRGLAARMEDEQVADLVSEQYVLTWVDIGRSDRNMDVLRRFGIDEIFGTPIMVITTDDGEIINAASMHDWRNSSLRSVDEVYSYLDGFAS